ncbi:MAG: hypothetical protein M0Z80_08455, partial [Treponema sp.]|nr:hypothetical protein [Treponema sp.]
MKKTTRSGAIPTRYIARQPIELRPTMRKIPLPTIHDQPHPHVCRVPEGRGVLVKVLQVGVDATDREINEALYGNAPP